MFRYIAMVLLALGLSWHSLLHAEGQTIGPPLLPPAVGESPKEKEIEAALRRPLTIDVREVSLEEALARIAKNTRLNIVIDNHALDDIGVDPSVLVTCSVRDTLLEHLLDQMLDCFDLSYIVQNDVLRVTSKLRANDYKPTRLYPIEDLIGKMHNDPKSKEKPNFNALENAIEWALGESAGTPSMVHGQAGWMIAFTGTRRSHQRLAAFITDLRATRQGNPAIPDAALEAALRKPTTFELKTQSLIDAIEWLSEMHKVPMSVDYQAFANSAIDPAVKVALNVRQPISLAAALEILLEPLELTHTIQYGTIRITCDVRTDSLIQTRVYSVQDLLDTRQGAKSTVDYLRDLIYDCVSPDEWSSYSGASRIWGLQLPWGMVLVVPCSRSAHNDIATLFDDLRALKTAGATNVGTVAAKAPRATSREKQSPVIAQSPRKECKPSHKRLHEAALEAALAKPTDFTIEELAIADALRRISDLQNLEIRLDHANLSGTQLNPELFYPFRTQGKVPLAEALEMILDDSGMACVIRHESLMVTSNDVAQSTVVARVYPVADLVNSNAPMTNNVGGMSDDPLPGLIVRTLEPQTWAVGNQEGHASVRLAYPPGGPALVAVCKHSVHAQISKLLAGIRAGGTSSASEDTIESALQQPAVVRIKQQPLGDAIEELVKKHELPAWPFSRRAAAEPVNLTVETPISLASIFDLLLDQAQMAYVIRHGMLWFDTKAKGRQIVETRIYSVDDLAARGSKGEEECRQLVRTIADLMPQAPAGGADNGASSFGVGAYQGPKGWIVVVTAPHRSHHHLAALLKSIRSTKP